MKRAARDMRFELAAVYRDQLRAIEKVREEQRVVTIDDIDRDVLGFYREGELVEIALLYVRAGKLADVATYSIKQAEIPDEEIVAAFLAQHYGASLMVPSKDSDEGGDDPVVVLVPDEVILPREPEGVDGISEWLSERAGHKVVLLFPKRGHRVDLLAMADDNARHSFAEKQRRADDVQDRLRDLQERLRLPVLPRRIECCDISHLGGGDTVGAVVAMIDGELDKKHYRTFNVRGDAVRDQAGQINDDYGAMYEVLARRFRRAIVAPQESADAPLQESADAPLQESAGALPQERADVSAGASAHAAAGRKARGAKEAQARGARGTSAARAGKGTGSCPTSSSSTAAAGSSRWPSQRRTTSGCTSCRSSPWRRSARAPCSRHLRARSRTPRSSSTGFTCPARRTPSPSGARRRRSSCSRGCATKPTASRIGRGCASERSGASHRRSTTSRGSGGKAKKALLTHVGNLAAIRAADDATLLAVPGITSRHVRALRAAFPASQ